MIGPKETATNNAYKENTLMNWIENLPEKCPPDEAFVPVNFKVFRLAITESTDEINFQSQRALKPNAIFKGVDECVARSVSVFIRRTI
jgi:hypothetical protein